MNRRQKPMQHKGFFALPVYDGAGEIEALVGKQ